MLWADWLWDASSSPGTSQKLHLLSELLNFDQDEVRTVGAFGALSSLLVALFCLLLGGEHRFSVW